MDRGTPRRLISLYRSWYGDRAARGFSVTLELAHRCNVRCVFCTRWEDPENLSLEAIRGIAADMAALGAAYASLSGGDPLVRSDFQEIVKVFVGHRVPVHINTNGVLLRTHAPFLRSVAGSLAGVTVSIDSHDPAVHDRIRGIPGTFRRALEGVEALRGSVPVSLACTLTGWTRDEVGTFARFARDLGVEFRFQPVHDDGANKLSPHREGVGFDADRAAGLGATLEASLAPEDGFVRRQYYRLFEPFLRRREALNRLRCVAAARLIYFVDPSGNVFPCDTRRDRPLGNVYRQSFAGIVHGAAATTWRETCRRGEHGCACMYACIAPNNVRFQDLPWIPLTRGGWPLRRRWSRRLAELAVSEPAAAATPGAARGSGDRAAFVSIVVANYNGGEFLIRSLRSLLDLEHPLDRREILFVDDASTDGSVALLRRHFFRELESGALRILPGARNLGVAGAYNRGIRETDARAEFILKVDNDLLPRPDALAALLQAAAEHPEGGIFGGRILTFDDDGRVHYLGGNLVFEPIGRFRFETPGDLAGGDGRVRRLDVVNGCMVLIRREVFGRVGLFPEFYGRYEYEDYDFALRARQLGFASLYCPAAVGRHRVSLSSSTPDLARLRLRQRARNGVIFARRFAPRGWYTRFLAYHLAKIPVDALLKGHPPALLLSGYLEGARLARRGEFTYPSLDPEPLAQPRVEAAVS